MLNGSFRSLPFMGVIRVNEKAARVGFTHGDPDWINLGQGQPEVGELSGAPPRVAHLQIEIADHAYGPVEGLPELREAVAAYFDVDPRHERRGPSAVAGFVRFSFGSPRDAVTVGLDRLAAMVGD